MPPTRDGGSEPNGTRHPYLKPVLKEYGPIAVMTSKVDKKGQRDGGTTTAAKT